MLDKSQIDEIIRTNPGVDASAVERSRDAMRKLAEAGIETGSYKLEPALGGGLLKRAQLASRIRQQGLEEGER